jgi:hypothetical protein
MEGATNKYYDIGSTTDRLSAASARGVLRFSILNWSAWSPERETRCLVFVGRRRQ